MDWGGEFEWEMAYSEHTPQVQNAIICISILATSAVESLLGLQYVAFDATW